MSLLYSLFIRFAQLAYWIAGHFNAKAKLFCSGRRNLFNNLHLAIHPNTAPVIWIHCASLGEFEQGRSVIEALRREFREHKILLTFFSPSGYEVRKNYNQADYIFYLPWDTRRNAIRFISMVKPVLAIFVKYEFWFNYSDQLKKRDIPLLSISAIFRPDQIYFKFYGGFNRKILKNYSWFFVQNTESIHLLRTLQINNVTQSGDTRFDRVYQLARQGDVIQMVQSFKGGQKLMVVGSCWKEDLNVLLPFINENQFNLKFIIAPHEVNEATLASLEKDLTVKSIRYSKAIYKMDVYQVLIIDNVGMLGQLYTYGEFAYIGGAFGKGLHNILEAACFGIPIFFGNKNYSKFKEAMDLIKLGGAFAVDSYSDFAKQFKTVSSPDTYRVASEVTRTYVEVNLGATEKIVQYCSTLLKSS